MHLRRNTLLAVSLLLLAANAYAQTPSDPNVLEGEMWTPRASTGTIHLHGGLFLPNKAAATSPTVGARIGINLASHVQLGVMADWSYKSKQLKQPSTSGLPGFEPELVLAQVDAHLIPAMVFMQVKLTDKFPIVPYAGVGAGYEWLILQAHDYRTGQDATSTYANPAWEGWVGMGLRLSDRVRVDSELFYNGAILERDVVDTNGATWREAVDAQGVGARVGLEFVY